MKKGLFFCFMFVIAASGFSQHHPRECDVLFRTQMARSINLNYPMNKEIFGDRMISKLLVEAALAGKIQAYTDETLTEVLSVNDLKEKLKVRNDEWHHEGWDQVNWDQEEYIQPEELYLLELGEELVFDKNRSEHYFIMKHLTVMIPLGVSYRGFQEQLCTFSYADCEKLFKQDENAVSAVPLKGGRKIPYDAIFIMKLFQSDFAKVGHGRVYFDQVYTKPQDVFLATKAAEERLVNYLWRLYNPE